MKLTKKKLKELIPYENNSKKHSQEQVEYIAKSIEDFGYLQPIVVNEKLEILIGHGRYEALKFLGIKETEVFIKEGLSEEEQIHLRIMDNRLNESPWDKKRLDFEMQRLSEMGIEFESFGLEMEVIEPPKIDVNPYGDTIIKNFILLYPDDSYERIIKQLDEIIESEGAESYTEIFKNILTHFNPQIS
jgi:hypothetical protein